MSGSESDVEEVNSEGAKRHYKTRTLNDKLKAVDYARSHPNAEKPNVSAASRRFGVNRKSIRRWMEWLQKFMKRHSLTLRKPTSVAQKPPSDYEDNFSSARAPFMALTRQDCG